MKTKKFGKSIPATIEKTEKGLENYEDKLKRIAEKYCGFSVKRFLKFLLAQVITFIVYTFLIWGALALWKLNTALPTFITKLPLRFWDIFFFVCCVNVAVSPWSIKNFKKIT